MIVKLRKGVSGKILVDLESTRRRRWSKHNPYTNTKYNYMRISPTGVVLVFDEKTWKFKSLGR